MEAHAWFLWKSNQNPRARSQLWPARFQCAGAVFLGRGPLGVDFFFPQLSFAGLRGKKKSLLDKSKSLQLSWVLGRESTGLTHRASLPTLCSLPVVCVGQGMERGKSSGWWFCFASRN